MSKFVKLTSVRGRNYYVLKSMIYTIDSAEIQVKDMYGIETGDANDMSVVFLTNGETLDAFDKPEEIISQMND